MVKLVVVAAVVLAILAGVDIGTRVAMEHQLEQRIDSAVPGAGASVTIHAFPWLPHLISQGRVARITAHANQVGQGPFVLDSVEVAVTNVRIDRHQLLHQRQLEIVSIGTGTVSADMTQAALDTLLGVNVVLGAGTAQVSVEGVTVTGHLSITNGNLRLDAPGLPVSVAIPTLPILPCLAQVTIVPGHLVGSCTFTQIPAALKTALQNS
jgi:hypothetical protein